MGLFTGTQNAYYNGADGIPNSGDESYGGYQFISLSDVIDNFVATYIGEGKILERTNRADVSFHAHRALAELSFDTFKSCKSQEIEVPPSLTMPMPHDYVNYVKFTWSDSSGIEHVIYPTRHTSNPFPVNQSPSWSEGDYVIAAQATAEAGAGDVEIYNGDIVDGEQPDILIGMKVYGPNIPEGTTVGHMFTMLPGFSTSHTRIIQFNDSSGQPIVFPDSWTNTIYFALADEMLQIQEESIVTFHEAGWNAGDNFIEVGPGETEEIKVGMIVNSYGFPTGTKVLDVANDPQYPWGGSVLQGMGGLNAVTNRIITVDNVATANSGSSGGYISFVTYEKVSDTWDKYKSITPSENINQDYRNDNNRFLNRGRRYGLHPEHSQTNGSFFIDCETGKIHFSSNLAGKTIILKYISDSLGTDGEMQVHKFAEEAIYKWIAYGCLSARIGVPEYIIKRFKKEKSAETRKAKLRLSNIKIEEITQILRNKSKWIKH